MNGSGNIQYGNQYRRPRRKKNNGHYILALVTAVLLVTTIILAVVTLGKSKKSNKKPDSSTDTTTLGPGVPGGEPGDTDIIVMTPEPTPPPKIESYQNPVLYPATANMDVQIGTPESQYSPSGRGAIQVVYQGDEKVSGYQRDSEIHLGDPLYYQQVGGILTFRGTNFRNCASWGTFTLDPSKDQHLEQIWEYDEIGAKNSSS